MAHEPTAITGTTTRNAGHTHPFSMTKDGRGWTGEGGADKHKHQINEGKALWSGTDHMHSIIGPDRQGA